MLNNAFEWERLVHPSPTDEMITTRTEIVTAILSSFDEEEDVLNAMRLVSAAITGLSPSVQADVEYGTILTEFTRGHHQAFSSKLSENALDLQLSACLAVGELLTRKTTDDTWGEPRPLIAGLILSAHLLRPVPAGTHLKAAQEILVANASAVLARCALVARLRPEFDEGVFEKVPSPGNVSEFWNQFKPVLASAFQSISKASSIDRDELEALWWLYNDFANTFAKKLSELSAFDVAFASPLELVDRALCPAPVSLKNIIQGLVARAAQSSTRTAKSLKSILSAWTPKVVAAMRLEDEAGECAVAFPKIFPLTWIANRVGQSGVVGGWEQEFEAKSGLKAGLKLSPEALAEQVFAERTAQRLLLPFCGESP